ncbi:MAG: hypothetical protein ABEJ68_03405 [Halobacteriaceae archaeon]
MQTRLATLARYGLYQFTLSLGILLLPIVLAARRAGLPIPLERVVARLVEAAGPA